MKLVDYIQNMSDEDMCVLMRHNELYMILDKDYQKCNTGDMYSLIMNFSMGILSPYGFPDFDEFKLVHEASSKQELKAYLLEHFPEEFI